MQSRIQPRRVPAGRGILWPFGTRCNYYRKRLINNDSGATENAGKKIGGKKKLL